MAPPTGYRDDRVAWEIVEILGTYFHELLKHRLRKSLYYGIMVDETTDISTNQQLILYIKFLDEKDGDFEIAVEYLDLVSPSSATAQDITAVLRLEFADGLEVDSYGTYIIWIGSKMACWFGCRWMFYYAWGERWCGIEAMCAEIRYVARKDQ